MNTMEMKGFEDQQVRPEPSPPPAGRWVPSGSDPRRKSVTLATILSFFPGLGHIYVGYYQVGFIHILIFASLVTILSQGAGGLEPLFGISLSFFILYNIVDGARRASLYNLALDTAAATQLPQIELPQNRGSVVGGLVLAGLGVLFLMHTRFGMDLYWIEDWWPLGLIGLGAWLFFKDRKSRSRSG